MQDTKMRQYTALMFLSNTSIVAENSKPQKCQKCSCERYFALPQDICSQSEIFSKQMEKHINQKCPQVGQYAVHSHLCARLLWMQKVTGQIINEDTLDI